jgi:hypothetical protein
MNSRGVAIVTVAIVLACAGMTAHAATDSSDGARHERFGGGMGVQAGYVSIGTRHGELAGMMLGLGGRLHVYIGRFVRLGSGGASIAMNYESGGSEESYYAVGYGGVTAEASLPVRKWRLSAGALVGGGSIDNLHIVRAHADDSIEAVRTSSGTLIVAPMLTVERRVSRSISLMIAGDWFFGPGFGERRQLLGPKMHFGVLFNR